MDGSWFDRWTRTFSSPTSRRRTLVALGLGALARAYETTESNAGSGCKHIGKKCQKSKECCSGICKGKKGKKRCKAHDSGGCVAGQNSCQGEEIICETSAGTGGVCFTTTGNAGYCAYHRVCFACQKDADCRTLCGADAACASCEDSCPETGNRFCIGTAQCQEP